jgi:hypothetical protein
MSSTYYRELLVLGFTYFWIKCMKNEIKSFEKSLEYYSSKLKHYNLGIGKVFYLLILKECTQTN